MSRIPTATAHLATVIQLLVAEIADDQSRTRFLEDKIKELSNYKEARGEDEARIKQLTDTLSNLITAVRCFDDAVANLGDRYFWNPREAASSDTMQVTTSFNALTKQMRVARDVLLDGNAAPRQNGPAVETFGGAGTAGKAGANVSET